MTRPETVMIVAGEASGDLHGARLVEALQRTRPGLFFYGVGGQELAGRGVEILFDYAALAVVGLFEVFGHLGEILRVLRALTAAMRQRRPALLILIDFPDFNLILARRAKKLGIPVFYYVSPQVWAWRSGRVRKIAQRVDRLAVILPFEAAFYRERGLTVSFVGHPLLDSVQPRLTREDFRRRLGIDDRTKLVGLLPGSRKKEVETLLPVFFEAAEMLAESSRAGITFLLMAAPGMTDRQLGLDGAIDRRLDCRVIREDRYSAMQACDAVMAASGTVTLELAILRTPMVAAYRVSSFTYLLGRGLIKVPHVTLVNLVAGRRIIPELLQNDVNAQKIFAEVAVLLEDEAVNQRMRADLDRVRQLLGSPGASERAAALAVELLQAGAF